MSMNKKLDLSRIETREMKAKNFGPTMEELKKKNNLPELINLSLNENPLGASPKVLEKIKAMVGEMSIYPDPDAREFRSLVAEEHGVSIEQVIPGNGACELISLVGQAFVNPDDETITPDPTFHVFREITSIMGGRNILSPLKEYRIDLEDIANRITSKTKLIIIVNPNNPTGDMLSDSELDSFIMEHGKDKIVVLDEAYGLFANPKEFPDATKYINQGLNIIALRTLSKAHALAGARVGYAIGSLELINRMQSIRPVFNVNRLAQIAGCEALKDKEHLNKCLTLVEEEKQYYYNEFKKMNMSYVPSAANFIFVDVGVDDVELSKALVKKGVIISAMTSSGYKGCIRITIGNHYQNEKMIASLKEAIEELK